MGGRRRERNELLGGIAAAEEGRRRGETSSAYHFPLFLVATNCAEKGLLRRAFQTEEREGGKNLSFKQCHAERSPLSSTTLKLP